MPIFEYVCDGCSRTFSIIKLGTDEGGPTCPVCGSKQVTKQFSTFSSPGGGEAAPSAGGFGGG